MSPNVRTISSSTAAQARRRGTGRRTTRSSTRCAASITTRRCSSSQASPSVCSERTRMRRASSSPTPCWCPRGRRGRTFRDLEDRGLTMYGQMTAGSWIYIGTQGILQGTYETFAAAARRHFGGTLSGRVVAHGRPRRHGRRPAAGRDDERRRRARGGGRRRSDRAAARDEVCRRIDDAIGRRARQN